MTSKSYTLEELSKLLDLPFSGDGSVVVSGVNDLKTATESEVSFCSNPKYTSLLKKTNAGIICVTRQIELIEGKNYLICKDASLGFEKVCKLLLTDHSQSGFSGIHQTAVIHPSAKVGKNAQVGPYVVIDRDVVIGDNAVIYSHVNIGPKTTIGNDCIIYANVVIREDCHLGNRVILQPSCVIGSCGYGYNNCLDTGAHLKIQHFGRVVIMDDVEIGAGTTIDRGRFDKTQIGKGTKIDNQCMIAHNCIIGENNLIISMSGLAGSVKTGNYVIIAAQSGLVGHIEIGDGVILGARSAPIKSIKKPGQYIGVPAQEAKKEVMEKIALRKLPEVLKKLKKAEKFFESLEETTK